MATARFEVERYQITLGGDLPTITACTDEVVRAIVGCYGKGYQLMINFVADGAPLPLPLYDAGKKTGALFVPVSLLPAYVDLPRNEKPVYAYCNSEHPQWTGLSTAHEEVGEGER